MLTFNGIRVALVQLAVGADKRSNIAAVVKEIYAAKSKGANLVALPVRFNFPYGIDYFAKCAETVPDGETSRALSEAAAGAGVCVVGGSIPERCGNQVFNTCTVWNNTGELIARHRKMHLFDIDIPGKITFRESDVTAAGDEITTFDYCGMKIGVGICYDLRFYEMAAVAAKKGCSFLIYPGAFSMTTGSRHWELLGRARANDLQLWVALVSPARDVNGGHIAWGHSMVIDPWGKVVESLDEKPNTLYANIDLDTVKQVRSEIPLYCQRRTDVYDTITIEKERCAKLQSL